MKALLFILIGAGAAAAAMLLFTRKREAEASKAKARRDALSNANVTNDITQVGVGGVLKLPPFGPLRAPIETYVKERHRYSDDEGAEWFELVCEHGRRELLLEWSWEGREIYLTGGFEDENPSLSDLGLDEETLAHFDEEREGEFEWGGVRWLYEDSGESFYHEADAHEREGFYGWGFEAEGEDRYINIEKWAGERDFEVYHLWQIDLRGVEIYEAGEGRS